KRDGHGPGDQGFPRRRVVARQDALLRRDQVRDEEHLHPERLLHPGQAGPRRPRRGGQARRGRQGHGPGPAHRSADGSDGLLAPLRRHAEGRSQDLRVPGHDAPQQADRRGRALLDDRLDQLRYALEKRQRGGEPRVLRQGFRGEGRGDVPGGPQAVRRDHSLRVRAPGPREEDERGAVLYLGTVLLSRDSGLGTRQTMKRTKPLIVVLLLVALDAAGASRPAGEQTKIDWLLREIGDSKAVFIRNGKEYEADKAVSHLKTKLFFAGSRVQTARQFIVGVASH